MFEMPSYYQTQSYLIEVPSFALDSLSSDCIFQEYPCDEDFYHLCNILMVENNLTTEDDPYTAIDLYTNLRRLLNDIFD